MKNIQKRAIYVGASYREIDPLNFLSFGMTGDVIGRAMGMYYFKPDGDAWHSGWLVPKSELYFPKD